MPTLRFFSAFEIEIDGIRRSGGKKSDPVEVTVDGKYLDLQKSLAAENEWEVWTASTDDAVSNFDFFYVLSDQAIRLEFLCDQVASTGEKTCMFLIPANTPFTLVGDDAFTGDWTSLDEGSPALIDRVRIFNNSSTDTASVRVVMVT